MEDVRSPAELDGCISLMEQDLIPFQLDATDHGARKSTVCIVQSAISWTVDAMKVLLLISLLLFQKPIENTFDQQQLAYMRTWNEAVALDVIANAARDSIQLSSELNSAERTEILKFINAAANAGATITALVESENRDGDKVEAIAILLRNLSLVEVDFSSLEKDPRVKKKVLSAQWQLGLLRGDYSGIRRDPASSTKFIWR